MRSFLLCALVGAATLVSGAVPISFTDCGGNGMYTIDSVTASSWPPIPGTSGVNLTQSVTIKGAITEGTWKTVSKFSGIDVATTSGGLCDGSYGDFQCPASGQVTINTATGDVPKPPFGLKGEVSTVAQILVGGELAGCWVVKFNV